MVVAILVEGACPGPSRAVVDFNSPFELFSRAGQRDREVACDLHSGRGIPGMISIHSVAGAIDLVIEAEGGDIGAIERIRSAIADLPEVAEITTFMVLERHLG